MEQRLPTSAGMVWEGELARLVAHARTNCMVLNLRGQCASSETSVSRAKDAAKAMGVQRWQSQAGLPNKPRLRSPYLLELHLVLCGGDRSTAGQKASELLDNSCLQCVEVTQDA